MRLFCESPVGVIGAQSAWTFEWQRAETIEALAVVTHLKPCAEQINALNSHAATCIFQARPTDRWTPLSFFAKTTLKYTVRTYFSRKYQINIDHDFEKWLWSLWSKYWSMCTHETS